MGLISQNLVNLNKIDEMLIKKTHVYINVCQIKR